MEVKALNINNDINQLKSYLNAEGAEIGVAINGQTIEAQHRPYPKDFLTLPDIPEYKESIKNVYDKKSFYSGLEEPKQLKQVIQNLENLVFGNSGFDSFDEILKSFMRNFMMKLKEKMTKTMLWNSELEMILILQNKQ